MFFTSTSGLLGNIGQANYGAAKMGIAGLSRIIAMEGARNNVRSNCLAPVAWTRMTQSVPVKDEAAAARRAVMAEKIRADQPARFSVAYGHPGRGQRLGPDLRLSGENIILYSQPRPVETVTKEEGWTVQTILAEAVPKMEPKFTPLSRPPLASQGFRSGVFFFFGLENFSHSHLPLPPSQEGPSPSITQIKKATQPRPAPAGSTSPQG